MLSGSQTAAPSSGRRGFVLFIAKAAFGGADAFAPIAAELKRDYGDWIETVVLFLDKRARREVSTSAFHEALFASTAKLVDLSRPPLRNRWFSRFWKGWKLVSLLTRHKIRGDKISILYPILGRDWRERALMRFFEAFGNLYWLPAIQLPWNERLAERQKPEMLARLIKADTGRCYNHVNHRVRNALCYVSPEEQLISSAWQWRAQLRFIGVPRLYSGWMQAAETFGRPALSAELERLGLDPRSEIAVIVLTNPHYFWYDDAMVFGTMLSDIRDEVARVFPGMPVLLKSKPVHDREFDLYLGDKDNPQSARITTLGLGALATRTRVAVTVNESSGFFDFAAAGVPVVEYARYNEKWRALTGIGSAWEGTPGLVTAHSRDELKSAIASARDGGFPVAGAEKLAAYFGHRKDLGVFVD